MNQLARIFVVLNLLLAGGFLMAAATFLQQSEDWKAKHKAALDENAKLTAEKDAEIQGLNSDLSATREDLQRKESKVSSQEDEIRSLQSDLTTARNAQSEAQQQLTMLQGTHQQAVSRLDQLTSNVGEMDELVENYRKAMVDSRKERDDAVEEKANAIAEREAAKQETHETEKTVTSLRREMQKMLTELTSYRESYPPPRLKDQPVVDGRVTRYNADANVVTVNRGKSHNVQVGHQFDILRDKMFICVVEITKVGDDYSIGHVTISMPGREPTAGDTATKLM